MKKLKFVVIALACLMAVPAFAERHKINFEGNWSTVRKSVTPEIPIRGTIENTTGDLTLNFLADLGEVVVTVTDGNGSVVYQESVQTDVVNDLTISLGSLTEGSVSVTDGENLVYGFIIQVSQVQLAKLELIREDICNIRQTLPFIS